MSHNEQCGCSECYVRRQQTPQMPMGVPVPAQQEIRGLGQKDPEWRFLGGTTPGTDTVRLREPVPLPIGVDWSTLRIVGASRLEVEAGEVVALLGEVHGQMLAIWWDKAERVIRARGVDQFEPSVA